MRTYIFLTTKEHLPLAQQELSCIFDTAVEELFSGCYALSLDLKPKEVAKQALRLGFCLKAFAVNKIFSKTRLVDIPTVFDERDVLDDYKIELFSSQSLSFTQQDLADVLHAATGKKKVNLFSPRHTYGFFWLDGNIFFCEQCYENKDKPSTRKSHLNIHNHPTAIHPKIARAMTALGRHKRFHDPFCGAGGIVIEGCLAGCVASGSDISEQLIAHAQENAAVHGLSPRFFCADALALEHFVDTYISDLPYGRSSTLTLERDELYRRFLLHARTVVKRLVLCLPAEQRVKELLDDSPWRVQFSYEFRVHKSLRRLIVILI